MQKAPSILIAGFGPAGASAAIFLSQQGFEVTIVERKRYKESDAILKVGESLPPDAKKLLQQLDVWHVFESANHLKCYANLSYWHSDQANYHDFMQHPNGHGWHIDRPAFETMLQEKAIDLGVKLINNNSVESLSFNNNQWQVKFSQALISQPQQNNPYDYIIDATGRSSAIARKLDADKLFDSQQLALVAFLQADKPFDDTTSLVETVPQGWWYSAQIPANRLACAFFFDPQKYTFKSSHQPPNWWALTEQSKHTHKRLQSANFTLIENPKMVNADGSILDKVCGKNWLAVGDAAMTYDPIASHGLMMSMVSARDAAQAIIARSQGQQTAFEQYAQRLYQSFMEYSNLRQGFYAV